MPQRQDRPIENAIDLADELTRVLDEAGRAGDDSIDPMSLMIAQAMARTLSDHLAVLVRARAA